MARIAGINLPNKPAAIALTYIHGIGRTSAKSICTSSDVDATMRINELSDDELGRIREVIDRDHQVEGELRREIAMNIKRLMDLGCYRGIRLTYRKRIWQGQQPHECGNANARILHRASRM